MARRKESVADLLVKAPWWVSAGLAVLIFVLLRWVLPALLSPGGAVAPALAQLSVWPAILLLFLAVLSAVFAAKRRRLVDSQTSLESLRVLPWQHFEWMIGEAYRRMGYEVTQFLGAGPDGGIDLTLRKDGATTLVQCKQWRVVLVGASIVREIYGLLAHHGAAAAVIITSGRFTADAIDFAAGKPIALVDGPQLLELVRSVQPPGAASRAASPSVSEFDTTAAPTCPTAAAS